MAEVYPEIASHDNTTDKRPPQHTSSELSASESNSLETRTTRQKISDLFTIFAAGAALISDGYQNNLMTMTNVVLRKEYPKQYTSYFSTAVSNALLVGEVIGQIVVGLTCDYFGRKFAIIVTTLMIVVGGILATAASGTTIHGMFWMLIVARGIVGFGTGGEYPASSTSASEAANEQNLKHRGPLFILVTNLPLSFGGPLAVSIFLIVLSAAGQTHLGIVWRVCMGIGCLLPLTVFYFRMRMLNSKLYRRGAIKKRVPYTLVLRYYWRRLLGTCGAWFLYDFITFPNGVFSATILSGVVKKGPHNIRSTAEWQLLLGAIALPGVILGAWLCNRIGRKNTMMLGFSGYLVFGLIIGCAYEQITKILPLFVIFYGLMQSCGNMGPGDMLGLLSSESYATAVRGTCYGISAALGKTGAALGTQAFTPIQLHLGKRWTFIVAAICGVAGILVTYFFVPDLKGDDLKNEDEAFRAFLVSKGWQGEMGEDDLQALADDVKDTIAKEDHERYEVFKSLETNDTFSSCDAVDGIVPIAILYDDVAVRAEARFVDSGLGQHRMAQFKRQVGGLLAAQGNGGREPETKTESCDDQVQGS
ncbi:MFS general substrate transporter [Aureobasidium subglaciale]|nr:MFS general substrate transporter [Aureobasidium subglaciale]